MANTIKILEEDKNKLDSLYNNLLIDFEGTATPSDVLSGKTFYSNPKNY